MRYSSLWTRWALVPVCALVLAACGGGGDSGGGGSDSSGSDGSAGPFAPYVGTWVHPECMSGLHAWHTGDSSRAWLDETAGYRVKALGGNKAEVTFFIHLYDSTNEQCQGKPVAELYSTHAVEFKDRTTGTIEGQAGTVPADRVTAVASAGDGFVVVHGKKYVPTKADLAGATYATGPLTWDTDDLRHYLKENFERTYGLWHYQPARTPGSKPRWYMELVDEDDLNSPHLDTPVDKDNYPTRIQEDHWQEKAD